jgi:hypothetical protein
MISDSMQMHRRYWPYHWQRLFQYMQHVTFARTYEEKFLCKTWDGGTLEFTTLDAVDQYARSVERIDKANGVEDDYVIRSRARLGRELTQDEVDHGLVVFTPDGSKVKFWRTP